MMTLRLQIIIGVLLIIVMMIFVSMVRKKSLDLKYALAWMLVVAVLLFVDCFPKSMNLMARFLGINAPTNMIFFLGFCFLVTIVFILTVSLSRLSHKNKEMAQELALLNKRVDEMSKTK